MIFQLDFTITRCFMSSQLIGAFSVLAQENDTYQFLLLRIFVHQLIKRADSVLISFDLLEEAKLVKISALKIVKNFQHQSLNTLNLPYVPLCDFERCVVKSVDSWFSPSY